MAYDYDIDRLARAKAAQGLSASAVADRAGVTPSTVANVLHRRTRKPDTVRRIAEALNLDLGEIVVPAEPPETAAGEPLTRPRGQGGDR